MTSVGSVRLIRSLLDGLHWLLWLAAGIATLNVAIGFLIGWPLGGGLGTSAWEYAGTPLRWLLFVGGILLATLIAPTYLAFGVTRRQFLRAGGGFGLLVVAFATLYLAGGYLVERALFVTAGRPQHFEQEHLFTSATQLHLVVAEYGLVLTGFLLSGWLVGSCYYRFGGWRGTLLLPLTTLPAFAIDNLLPAGGWTGFLPGTVWQRVGQLPTAAAIGLAVAVLAAGAAAITLVSRDYPIRSRRRP